MPKLAERIEKKLFERCPDLKKRYKNWCLDFFDVLNDDNNVRFKQLPKFVHGSPSSGLYI